MVEKQVVFDILFTKVHCSKDKDVIWSAEWGYTAVTAIFSSLSSASSGVSILLFINNNFAFQLLKIFSDPNGRFLIIVKTLTLVNIYAPNKNDPSFFESVLKMLLTFECEESVCMGRRF